MRLIDADEIRIKPDFIFYGVCGTPVIRCEDLARIINDMPTIEPQKWIPVSDRLPNTEVLCCDTHGEMIIAYVFTDKTSDTGFSAESDTEYMYNCVAWQPLPDPWKGEE